MISFLSHFTGHKFKGHWQDADKGRQTDKIFCQLTPNHKTLLWGEDVDITNPSNAKRIAVSDITSVEFSASRDKIVINYSDQQKTLELEMESRGTKDKTSLLEYWADGLRYITQAVIV